MGSFLLVLAVILVIAALVFGVVALISGDDPGLVLAEPDDRAVPLPGDRPLEESDLVTVRFDTALRGYQMEQVDRALRRTAYDIGYKEEMIGVLEAEVTALRDGRTDEADRLRQAREAAAPGQSGQTRSGFSGLDYESDLSESDVAEADLADSDLADSDLADSDVTEADMADSDDEAGDDLTVASAGEAEIDAEIAASEGPRSRG